MTDSLAKPRYKNAWHVVQVVFREKDLASRSKLGNTVAGLGNFYRVSLEKKRHAFVTNGQNEPGNRTGCVAGLSHQRSSLGRMGSCNESSRGERGMSRVAFSRRHSRIS